MQGPAGIFIHKQSENDVVMLATGTGIAPIYSIIYTQLSTSYPPATPKRSFGGRGKLQDTSYKKQATNYYLFWGLKYKQNIYLKSELDELASKNPNFQYKICLSQEIDISDPNCMKGRVTHGYQIFSESYPPATPKRSFGGRGKLQVTSCDYYICGGKHIVDSLREYLSEKNIPKTQIHFEKFTI